MADSGLDVVTGAFGYSGRYIAQRLLGAGRRVVTLTNHPGRPDPFGGSVETAPFRFDEPVALARSLSGADSLYNTYWVRFSHGAITFDQAVRNTRILFRAAAEAGVRRIVHVSITNPGVDSQLPYFRGKALLEEDLKAAGPSYAIVRPTVIFGREDILINNIAWTVRHYPVFGVPGDGQYRIQPIYVQDMAQIAVDAGQETGNRTIDAVGPETFTFDDLVRTVARAVRRRPWIVHLPPGIALFASSIVGRMVGDVILTREEVAGLMANLLISSQPPTGKTRLTDWIAENAATLGAEYHSELARHFRVADGSGR